MEPRGSMTRTRERSEAIWNAVFDLRKYFMTMTGRPHMGLVGQLVYPKQDEGTFQNEWYRRKDEFKDADAWERVAALQTFFWQNHARVLETLQSGIPFYAKWESVGNEGRRHRSPDDPAYAEAIWVPSSSCLP